MNDDEHPINAELASAYLDGELDVAERAAVAQDPQAMALVRSFTRIRAELGRIEPVDDDTRSAAMAAALSEFDTIHESSPPLVTSISATVTSLDTHRRLVAYRLIKIAAAAAIVVVVGVVALNATKGNDRSSSASDQTSAATAAADAALPALKSAETGAPAATTPALAPAAGNASLALPAIDSTEALAAYAAGIEAGRRTGSAAAGTAAPAATSAAAAATPASAQTSDAAAQPACLTPNLAVLGGEISFQGTPAFAVRDTSSGALQAIDAADCRPLTPALP